MFDLLTTTGVLFTCTAAVPDPSQMQIVEFTINSPFTEVASIVNVSTLAILGRSVAQMLVAHFEHYERRTNNAE